MSPNAVIDEVHRLRAARPRRRVLPDRAEVVLRPEAGPEPESALPRRQRRRVGARQLQGQRDHGARPAPLHRGLPHRRACGRVEERLRLHPRRVHRAVRGTASPPSRSCRTRPELRGDVTIVLHRGAGAYICGEETALLESLEGKRGQPRTKPPFPAVQGLYASPTVVNNVETMATLPPIIEMGGAEYAKLGVAGLARHASGLDLGTRREARELRDRERHQHARADLRPRRRHSRRPRSSRRSFPAARRP